MAGTFSTAMARPVPVVAGLMALGAVLAFLEMGTPAALAFMAAGLVVMFAYGKNDHPQ
ncbi:hypothetical protein [Belnapia sp. F-4-1]|uniref:hypothetical protein n=1 Tax=Belnapia sp. F-4-1 TaxID=1545443 RepID=UPI001364DD70|nr:hypothetical protein [Belnapia sp. F-4-1]